MILIQNLTAYYKYKFSFESQSIHFTKKYSEFPKDCLFDRKKVTKHE